MENTLKKRLLLEINEDAQRQYIDAESVFTAWESAKKSAAEVRGTMFWRNQNGAEYLIKMSVNSAQKSLGPRSTENEAIYKSFMERKERTEARLTDLRKTLERHQRMNKALRVGRAPQILVDILNRIDNAGLADYFTVIGTHALYAYEAAVAARFVSPAAMTTQDVDLLWDVRKRLSFTTQMETLGVSFLGLLRKVDPTFEIRNDQRYTAVNSKGFEVDIIRRERKDDDPHPLRITDDEDDFFVVEARRAGVLLDSAKFSSMIVSSSGHMARMRTISPVVFAKFKRWMAGQADRDERKRHRDVLQAELVEELIREYLPNLN